MKRRSRSEASAGPLVQSKNNLLSSAKIRCRISRILKTGDFSRKLGFILNYSPVFKQNWGRTKILTQFSLSKLGVFEDVCPVFTIKTGINKNIPVFQNRVDVIGRSIDISTGRYFLGKRKGACNNNVCTSIIHRYFLQAHSGRV
jgi:hypothetical protein